ncbi:MAG: RsmB/NOP family class I SAM-dependent RNA methyltransferase [Candidatus Heimdallarchaeota archaeon]|nr:RsmB/NOP family class I SAM-dependent RNA methyltransferase [Candidatus Heimdallarchaeota archaeon]MDH5646136.1 RsmB/NOP family class I SAM-dependent RNA methyltransferase [Candidatus Heimdallarchaeota archaeon]
MNSIESLLKLRPEDLIKTLRVNLLKIGREEAMENLAEENIITKIHPFIPEGLIITKGSNKVGSSLSYLAGEVMPQGLGSMLTVLALDPKPGDTILDMAAAPGGKTCFIAERMQNKGRLVANDISFKRLKALLFNLARHNIQNISVINNNALYLDLPMQFDKILLDAPCTGEGLIVSQPNRKRSRDIHDIYALQKTQISLVKKAISMLNKGGSCVYSTCSLSPLENELVIDQFRDQIEIQEINIPGDCGLNSINDEFIKTKRLIPSKHKCDGFFICKFEVKL